MIPNKPKVQFNALQVTSPNRRVNTYHRSRAEPGPPGFKRAVDVINIRTKYRPDTNNLVELIDQHRAAGLIHGTQSLGSNACVYDDYFTSENGKNDRQCINIADLTDRTISQGDLSTLNIRTRKWDENVASLIIPFISDNSYTPIVTPIEHYHIGAHVYTFHAEMMDLLIGISANMNQTWDGLPLEIGSEILHDYLIKKLHDTDSITMLHLFVTIIVCRLFNNNTKLSCPKHKLYGYINTTELASDFSAVALKLNGETDEPKCDTCSAIMFLHTLSGYLRVENIKYAPLGVVLLSDEEKMNLAYALDGSDVQMNLYDAMNVTKYVPINNILDSMATFTFTRSLHGLCERVPAVTTSSSDANAVFSRFSFATATKNIVAIMYRVVSSIDEQSTIVSVDYSNKSGRGNKSNSATNDKKRYGRLAIQYLHDSEFDGMQLTSLIRLYSIISYSRVMLSNGVTSFSLYIASADESIVKRGSAKASVNIKLESPAGKQVFRSDFLKTVELMPNALFTWKANQLHVSSVVANQSNRVSFIEAKMSHSIDCDMQPSYIRTATAYMLTAMVRILSSEGIQLRTYNRTETESRLRFASIDTDYESTETLLTKALSKKYRSGPNGYISKAFIHMFQKYNIDVVQFFPEKVVVNLTICNYFKSEGVVANIVSPTEIIYLKKLSRDFIGGMISPLSENDSVLTSLKMPPTATRYDGVEDQDSFDEESIYEQNPLS